MKAEKQEEGEGASGCGVKVGGCRCLTLATKSARIEGQVAVEWTRGEWVQRVGTPMDAMGKNGTDSN